MKLLWSFLLRDFQTQVSYRSAFVLGFFGLFFRAFTFYFISRLIGDGAAPYLGAYGGDYFAFVLIGIAFNGYFGVGLSAFAGALREAQTTGTLEAVLMTPTPLSAMIVGSALWSYLFTTLQVVIYLLLGLFLGLDLSAANIPLALVTLLLSVAVFAAIGIIAAGIIMVIKRGDPLTTLIGSVSALLGGIYYPIELLPEWLRAVSHLLPITYAVRLMREALLAGAGWREAFPDLLALAIFAAVLLPAAFFAFRLAVDRARAAGSLAQY